MFTKKKGKRLYGEWEIGYNVRDERDFNEQALSVLLLTEGRATVDLS